MIPGLYSLTSLNLAIKAAPSDWRPLVFTNGCFDLIHAGHVRYLKSAKALGKMLVVGLNSDESVQTLKPRKHHLPAKPIVPEIQRAEVLAALKPVDAVIIFAETTATQTIETLKPDIYVKGGDYNLDRLPEASAVQTYGGCIELIDIEVPISTTAIIQYILSSARTDNNFLT